MNNEFNQVINKLMNMEVSLKDLSDLIIDMKTSVLCVIHLNKVEFSLNENELQSFLESDDFDIDILQDSINISHDNATLNKFKNTIWSELFELEDKQNILLLKKSKKMLYKTVHSKLYDFYKSTLYDIDPKITMTNINSLNTISKKIYMLYFLLNDFKELQYDINLNSIGIITNNLISILTDTNNSNQLLKEEIVALTNTNNENSTKIKELKKEYIYLQKTNKSFTQKILDNKNNEIEKEKKILNTLKKELKDSLKKHENITYNVLKKSYENMNENNLNLIASLKEENKTLKLDNKSLNSEILNLNEINHSLLEEIKTLTSSSQESSTLAVEENNSFDIKEDAIKENSVIPINNDFHKKKIGYVTFKDNNIFVNYLDGSSEILKNIPDNVLIGINQFVLTTIDDEFIYAYKQFFSGEGSVGEFCKLTQAENGLIAYNGEATFNINSNLKLNADYYIGVVNNYEIKKLFKSLDFIFD